MELQDEFENALQHPEAFKPLCELALKLISEGQTRQQVYDSFEQFRDYLREANREANEDLIMDVMNCISGWCSPHVRLYE